MTAGRLTWSAEDWDEIVIGPKKVRALRVVYQMVADTVAVREQLEWEMRLEVRDARVAPADRLSRTLT